MREMIAIALCDLAFLIMPKSDRWVLAKHFETLNPMPDDGPGKFTQ